MEYKQLHTGGKIPVLGLGTWTVGGSMSPNHAKDPHYLEIIRHAVALGYTHIDTAEIYSGGHTEELVGSALDNFPRDELFITTKVWHTHLLFAQVIHALDGSLKRLKMDYVDLYLIHWPNSQVPLDESFEGLNRVIQQGKVRHLGVSNFNLEQMQLAQEVSATPIITNQVPYSLTNRRYQEMGVLEYCQQRGILLTAYTPFDRGAVIRNKHVQQIAQKYGATPAQIGLYWLIRQPSVITIPMSANPDHLAANLGGLELQVQPEDMQKLDELVYSGR